MTQEIWLMRHGFYHWSSGSLTPDGIAGVQQAAQAFKNQALTLYHSPVRRCVETAMIINDHVPGSRLHEIAWLGETAMVPENCLSLLQGEIILIVSHQPILQQIVGQVSEQWDSLDFRCGVPFKLVGG